MGSTCPQTSSFLHVLGLLPSTGAAPVWGSTWPDTLLETTSGLMGAAPGKRVNSLTWENDEGWKGRFLGLQAGFESGGPMCTHEGGSG